MVLWHSNQNQLSGVGGWDFIEILVISLLTATTRHCIPLMFSCFVLRHMGVLYEYRDSSRMKCRIHCIRSMPIGPVAVEYAWTTEIRPSWQWSHLCWAKRFSLTALGQAGCGHKRLSRRAVGQPVFLSLFYWVPWKTRLSLFSFWRGSRFQLCRRRRDAPNHLRYRFIQAWCRQD